MNDDSNCKTRCSFDRSMKPKPSFQIETMCNCNRVNTRVQKRKKEENGVKTDIRYIFV